MQKAINTRDILSVSQLNRQARDLLEQGLPLLWIEGEVSNLARPASGHLYFTLKDAHAQIRCALFRNRNRAANTRIENGGQVIVKARISLYEARGDYQLIVEQIEEAGDGALRRAFEALKQKLSQQGLFNDIHKQALPTLPTRIGIITSPTGAAIRDILSILQRRFPSIPVLIYPVAVQGDHAADEIAAAIKQADQRQDCAVLIIGRGGGSLEDLWAFNEEVVAHAIHQCSIPIVSAVGHEIDFTISDLVADHRAPTPSAAAEILSPDQREWLDKLQHITDKLYRSFQHHINQSAQKLDWLGQRLHQQHPGQRLKIQQQTLNDQIHRLTHVINNKLIQNNNQLSLLTARLQHNNPLAFIHQQGQRLQAMQKRLQQTIKHSMEQHQARFKQCAMALNMVSPLATLTRGYSITKDSQSGAILREASKIHIDDCVEVQLKQGRLFCKVEGISEK
ncbi:MAG: exodeoxyribonuclease VII large subunit [Gammaproteobacteria bacterium]|nr:exodeoxyribonuclease VII large subunit [Gammaproteobacteria bacterium]